MRPLFVDSAVVAKEESLEGKLIMNISDDIPLMIYVVIDGRARQIDLKGMHLFSNDGNDGNLALFKNNKTEPKSENLSKEDFNKKYNVGEPLPPQNKLVKLHKSDAVFMMDTIHGQIVMRPVDEDAIEFYGFDGSFDTAEKYDPRNAVPVGPRIKKGGNRGLVSSAWLHRLECVDCCFKSDDDRDKHWEKTLSDVLGDIPHKEDIMKNKDEIIDAIKNNHQQPPKILHAVKDHIIKNHGQQYQSQPTKQRRQELNEESNEEMKEEVAKPRRQETESDKKGGNVILKCWDKFAWVLFDVINVALNMCGLGIRWNNWNSETAWKIPEFQKNGEAMIKEFRTITKGFSRHSSISTNGNVCIELVKCIEKYIGWRTLFSRIYNAFDIGLNRDSWYSWWNWTKMIIVLVAQITAWIWTDGLAFAAEIILLLESVVDFVVHIIDLTNCID